MAADIVLGVAPLVWQLYLELDNYRDGLKHRDTEVETAKVQLDIFTNWLQFISEDIISQVPLDTKTQDLIHRATVVARNQMEELAQFIKSLHLDVETSQSRRAQFKKRAGKLMYPFQRDQLKELQGRLESLNKILEAALKPVQHHVQQQPHQETHAALAGITELLQKLVATTTPLQESNRRGSNDSKATASSSPRSPRPLTQDETECLQAFRLTQGDRDASYEWYKDRVDERVADTCQWFLNHDNYKTWLHQRAGPLLVTADPGCGKSVLAKYLIDHGLPRDATVCYFFFKDQDQNKVNQALCAVLHQLFSARPDLLHHARGAKERNGKGLVHITAELRAIFEAAVRDPRAGETIFVFDALDECDPADLRILVDVMNDAFLDAPPGFRIKCLMTSRPYEQVSGEFLYLAEKFPQIRIPGEQESETIRMEVERVIQVRVKQLAKKRNLSVKLQEHLISRLLEASHRTYLWVYLVFEYLEEEAFKKTARGLDDVLKTLPNSVNDAYEKILSRSKETDFVRKALSLIVAAIRPLAVPELNVALNVELEHQSNFDLDLEEDEEFERRLRECCGLFITINHGKIYLLHQTAREFLLQHTPSETEKVGITANVSGGASTLKEWRWQHSFNSSEANLTYVEACVAYLRNLDPKIFSLEPPGTGEEEVDRLKESHLENLNFLEYSVHRWEQHVRLARNSPDTSSLTKLLGFKDGHSETYWHMVCFQRTSDRSRFRAKEYSMAQYQIHLAAALDHLKVVEYLVQSGASVNAMPGDQLDSPLRHACMAGSCEIARFLLKKGANVNGAADESVLGQTALFPTTTWADEDVVEVLLEHGADPNYKDRSGRTPLFFAKTGRMALQFLNAGAKVNIVDHEGSTPLFWATTLESESVVRVLLQWGADANIRLSDGTTALTQAIKTGWWEGLELMLQNGGDINMTGPEGRHSVWSLVAEKALSAPLGSHEKPLPSRLLNMIQRKLQPDSICTQGTTPLHIAAYHGLEDCIEQLLEDGAVVDARDAAQATPLIMVASGSRSTASLKSLLNAGADPNASSDTITPLLAAIHYEWHDGVRILLTAGADPNIECEWAGPPALHIAASYGLEAILNDLIEKGADVNKVDRQGKSAIHLAKEFGEYNIVKTLLAAGAQDEMVEQP